MSELQNVFTNNPTMEIMNSHDAAANLARGVTSIITVQCDELPAPQRWITPPPLHQTIIISLILVLLLVTSSTLNTISGATAPLPAWGNTPHHHHFPPSLELRTSFKLLTQRNRKEIVAGNDDFHAVKASQNKLYPSGKKLINNETRLMSTSTQDVRLDVF